MKGKSGVILDRFKELVDTKTREEIATAIGCDTSLVTKHYSGDRTITLDYAVKYAEFFNVSVDYLVGLSSATTFDSDVKAVCKYTGLSDKTVNLLNYMTSQENSDLIFLTTFIDKFLDSDCFLSLLENYNDCRFNLLNAINLYENALDTSSEASFNEIVSEAKKSKILSDMYFNINIKNFENLADNFFDLSEYHKDYIAAKEDAENFGHEYGYIKPRIQTAEQAISEIVVSKQVPVNNSTALHDIKKDFENIINEAIMFVENHKGNDDKGETNE